MDGFNPPEQGQQGSESEDSMGLRGRLRARLEGLLSLQVFYASGVINVAGKRGHDFSIRIFGPCHKRHYFE